MNLDELEFSEDEYDSLILAAAAAGDIVISDGDVIQTAAERAYVAYLCFRLVLAGELGLRVRKGKVYFFALEAARKRGQLADKRVKRIKRNTSPTPSDNPRNGPVRGAKPGRSRARPRPAHRG